MELKYGVSADKVRELKTILKARFKDRMEIIGDVKVKFYDYDVNIARKIAATLKMNNEKLLIETNLRSTPILYSNILAWNILEKENSINIQLRADDIFENCLIEFTSGAQVIQAVKFISRPKSPEGGYYEHNVSSSTHDSGRGESQGMHSSYNSENSSANEN